MNNKLDDIEDIKIDNIEDIKIDDIEDIKIDINISNKIITNIKLIPYFICNGKCNKCIEQFCK